MSQYILEISNVTKKFPGVTALNKVSFNLKKGEVHALVGENGAGKSTLMHILAGIHQPNEGIIKIKNKRVDIQNPHTSVKLGIGVVFQELSLVDNLSIAENIFVNRQPLKKIGFVNKKELFNKTNELLSLFKLDFEPDLLVKELSTADKQLIEILKALSQNPDLLILDEPTSSLCKEEVTRLFEIINNLKNNDISIIYISHQLNEIFTICDRVTVFRDGQYINTKETNNTSEEELVSMMVGRDVLDVYGTPKFSSGKIYFELKNINFNEKITNVSLSLQKGEVLGVFGLVGAGRTELGETIFGINSNFNGDVYLNEEKINISKPKDAIEHGIAYLTEDRKNKGLFLDTSVKYNIIISDLNNFLKNKLKFLDENKISNFSEKIVNKFRVITPSINSLVRSLSGGNQQKVLLAKWLAINPKVLIVDEPTRGVDIGAKSEIYNYLRELTEKGIGVIVLSSDLPEVIGISDRILVMRNGEIVDEKKSENATEENILASASGVCSTN